MLIGFIGQGWIGNSYSNNLEKRGYEVVRYGLEKQYRHNKDRLLECDIVFVAVPTPTVVDRFVGDAIEDALTLLSDGTRVVVKSTVRPGYTTELQQQFPNLYVFHSPEFLSVNTAQHDADFPERNIVGIPYQFIDDTTYQTYAEEILAVLPEAPFSLVCSAYEAELIKYGHNISGVFQIIFYNLMYDLAEKLECDWETLRQSFENDSYMAHQYANPVHKSGRGAGGGCFIKDYAAFVGSYKEFLPDDSEGIALLEQLQAKNIQLLINTSKDLEELRKVHGDRIAARESGVKKKV